MLMRAIGLSLTCLILFQAGLQAASLSKQQQEWLSAAERHERAGWIYLHVEGGPRERGFQHGYLLAKEIAECLRVIRAHWKNDTSMEWSWLSYIGGTGNDVVLTQTTQPANPQISTIAKQLNGQMLLTGLGEVGAGFEVFASTNLVSTNWVNLGVI